MHEMIQSYLDQLYKPHAHEIKKSLFFYQNEHYGELYYYSFMSLLRHLKLTDKDHFLDIGSGLGKIIFQTFLTTHPASVSGIEINALRYQIAIKAQESLRQQLPDMFAPAKILQIIHGDFLQYDLSQTTVIYVCSTVFSFDLLDAIGKKINAMPYIRTIASLRKLPNLDAFKLSKKIFLHADWEKVPCYIYERKL